MEPDRESAPASARKSDRNVIKGSLPSFFCVDSPDALMQKGLQHNNPRLCVVLFHTQPVI